MSEDVPKPTFAVDQMLGSLAKWLRMLGYDTIYDKTMDDKQIAAAARADNRFVLTRDKELSKEPGAMLIETEDLEAQLTVVREKFGLKFSEDTIRCTQCNGELVSLPKEEANGSVPEGAFASNDKFWKCGGCGKVYWRGSHWLGIMERFRKLNLA
ncbi:MAG: Mut7-C RNAse domain-containing protein [Candidatus Thermoplasmatota archaeon]|nr:Mut7-C RNAse domain-containing protein [Candidatus Thermoplasmatota archaeon]